MRAMRWRTKRGERFWATTSRSSRVLFGLAMFFFFAGLAILFDVPRASHPPLWGLAIYAAVFGATVVTYAFAVLWDLRLIPLAVVSYVATSAIGTWVTHLRPTPTMLTHQQRLEVDAFACSALVLLGYLLFIRFIHRMARGHAELRTEVRLAKEIHDSLVPVVTGSVDRADCDGRSRASGAIGGDLVDVVETPEGTTFYVVDVSGHGVRASVLMAMLRTAARAALADGATLPGLLRQMNRTLCELHRPDLFATCAVLWLGRSGEARYALAGHLPIMRREASSRFVAELDHGGPPLGLNRDQEYSATSVEAAIGDCFLLITDGLTEVFRSDGRELGVEAIRAAAFEGNGAPAEVAARVLSCAGAFGRQLDDQTVLVVRIG